MLPRLIQLSEFDPDQKILKYHKKAGSSCEYRRPKPQSNKSGGREQAIDATRAMSAGTRVALLSFSGLLANDVSYGTLKAVLRAAKRVHPKYPTRAERPRGATQICTLSLTPPEMDGDILEGGCADVIEGAEACQEVGDDVREAEPVAVPQMMSPVLQEIQPPPVSRLRRKKRRKRYPVPNCGADGIKRVHDRHTSVSGTENQERCAAKKAISSQRKQRRPDISIPTDVRRSGKRVRIREQCADESAKAGESINVLVTKLAEQDSKTEKVIWEHLRQMLLRRGDRFVQFAKAMDRVFDNADPIAVCTRVSSSPPIVFYSVQFWSSAWKDFMREPHA